VPTFRRDRERDLRAAIRRRGRVAMRQWHGLAVVATIIALCGCSLGDHDVGPEGEIVFTFQRGGSSLLPAEADSALVRVWDRSTGGSTVRAFAIPADVSASVSIPVSAYIGTLYQVDAVAFHSAENDHRVALAAGEVQGVTVAAGQNSVLHFAISPWTATLDAPDTLVSGASATFTLTLGDAVPVEDVFASAATLTYEIGPMGTPQQADVTRTGKVATATFVVPEVAADTALYFQYSFDIDTNAFETGGATFTADVPEPTAGEALLRLPVRAALGGARRVR
jgi:hypothetical protein